VSKQVYVVRVYTTPDSAVTYLNHIQMAQTKNTPSFDLWRTTAAENCENGFMSNPGTTTRMVKTLTFTLNQIIFQTDR